MSLVVDESADHSDHGAEILWLGVVSSRCAWTLLLLKNMIAWCIVLITWWHRWLLDWFVAEGICFYWYSNEINKTRLLDYYRLSFDLPHFKKFRIYLLRWCDFIEEKKEYIKNNIYAALFYMLCFITLDSPRPHLQFSSPHKNVVVLLCAKWCGCRVFDSRDGASVCSRSNKSAFRLLVTNSTGFIHNCLN